MTDASRVVMATAAGTGMATLPALVATGHPWLGAAGLLLSFASWALHTRQRAHAELAQDQAVLSYAHTSVFMGVDPAPVIQAMRRRPQDVLKGAEGDDGPQKLHLPPGSRP